VHSVGLESCPVPEGGKRLQTDDLITVIWNQKTFHCVVESPMSEAATAQFYREFYESHGWTAADWSGLKNHESPYLSVHRGTPWGSLIRWNYQSRDVRIWTDKEGKTIVDSGGWVEYAPLTWPRWIVEQGLMYLLWPLMFTPGGDIILYPLGAVIFVIF